MRLGRTVVSDSVNALKITRDAWAEVDHNARATLVEVEVVCSDLAEHRRRVETRPQDIKGLPPPHWSEVNDRIYGAWPAPHILIDTAHKSIHHTEVELTQRLTSIGLVPA